MAARAFMEQVRTVILQRRVRETQSRSEPAGAFQSLIAHSIVREDKKGAIWSGIRGCNTRAAKSSCPI